MVRSGVFLRKCKKALEIQKRSGIKGLFYEVGMHQRRRKNPGHRNDFGETAAYTYGDIQWVCPYMDCLDLKEFGTQIKLAVQVHVYYVELLDEIIRELNKIPYPWDCYVSTNNKRKKKLIQEKMKKTCRCVNLEVVVYPNRGRDVAPFLLQMKDCICDYKYVCHIHTKKDRHSVYGDNWRKYLFRHLFGNADYLERLFYLFEHNPEWGIVYPPVYPVVEKQMQWGANEAGERKLLERLGITVKLPDVPEFPAGNMFWARTESIKKIFAQNWSSKDFPIEAGQMDGTLAHQMERAWVFAARKMGYQKKHVYNACFCPDRLSEKKRLLVYAHYDRQQLVAKEDWNTLSMFRKFCKQIYFVTNSRLGRMETEHVKTLADCVLERENIGYDFGAWRDALLRLGKCSLDEFDELILLNNSCILSKNDVRKMFYEMEKKDLDFWGNTCSPFLSDGSYIGESVIGEHLQSYCLVFQKKVFASAVFWKFWEELPECRDRKEAIAKCETKLTQYFSKDGFFYGAYINESYYMNQLLGCSNALYEKPEALVLLGSPFIKKATGTGMDLEL